MDDVTGVGWFDASRLIVSASPIYGKPGLYVIDCKSKRVELLVAPKTRNTAYPDGADYFELHAIAKDTVRYYYGADVDKIDFASLRTPAHLQTHQLN